LQDEPDGEYETLNIKENTLNKLVDVNSDLLVESVSSRREKALGFALETFNKIQNKKAPQFYDLNVKAEVVEN